MTKEEALVFGKPYRVLIPDSAGFNCLPCIPKDPRKDGCKVSEIPNLSFIVYDGEQQVEDLKLYVFCFDGMKVMIGEGALEFLKRKFQKKL